MYMYKHSYMYMYDARCKYTCLVTQGVQLEKKKLLQQWSNTLIGMRRRDEGYAALTTAIKSVGEGD